jgi:phage gpG-like protein
VLKISGNIAGIRAFGQKVTKLGSSEAKRSVLANVGEEAIELIREGFDSESDPYGAGWKPTLRGGKILQDTGRLRSSFHRRSLSASRVVIGSGAKYGGYHQRGTRRLVRRAMVPYRELPGPWRERLVAAARLAWTSSAGF